MCEVVVGASESSSLQLWSSHNNTAIETPESVCAVDVKGLNGGRPHQRRQLHCKGYRNPSCEDDTSLAARSPTL